MITLLKHMFSKLLYDELAVRRWSRSILIFAGMSGVAFATQLAELVHDPKLSMWFKIGAAVFAAAGGAVTAGERNARP